MNPASKKWLDFAREDLLMAELALNERDESLQAIENARSCLEIAESA